ncbi:MAG TPA: phosphotransferase family protein [Candidatus Ligilactobacillus excrementigallinarum]|uniref:Phosphotransferase family protein n=1 Tax=Candidatus Ligilactobacillus excrementigallinarum TaxID=2838641 RepID=A0A9D1UXX9_9LACO|nr:phosphotransferase family protein [Candidatus Ligilactobacillus excrementigallinarum]
MNSNQKKGWRILPVHGDTGMAYMGEHNEKRLFLKRNTSPFLAALSLEEITPRLVWTKRMASGDTLTAQEWLNGRNLRPDEMKQEKVSALLFRVHHSALLKRMWKQVGGVVTTPMKLLDECYLNLSPDLRSHPLIKKVLNTLKKNQPELERSNYEVCHGDLNHKNWLLSDTNKLYLVDWDSAKLADPALDLSMLMCQYVPRSEWHEWLEQYLHAQPSENLIQRIVWYSMLNLVQQIEECHRRGRFHEMNQDIIKLSKIVKEQNYFEL